MLPKLLVLAIGADGKALGAGADTLGAGGMLDGKDVGVALLAAPATFS